MLRIFILTILTTLSQIALGISGPPVLGIYIDNPHNEALIDGAVWSMFNDKGAVSVQKLTYEEVSGAVPLPDDLTHIAAFLSEPGDPIANTIRTYGLETIWLGDSEQGLYGTGEYGFSPHGSNQISNLVHQIWNSGQFRGLVVTENQIKIKSLAKQFAAEWQYFGGEISAIVTLDPSDGDLLTPIYRGLTGRLEESLTPKDVTPLKYDELALAPDFIVYVGGESLTDSVTGALKWLAFTGEIFVYSQAQPCGEKDRIFNNDVYYKFPYPPGCISGLPEINQLDERDRDLYIWGMSLARLVAEWRSFENGLQVNTPMGYIFREGQTANAWLPLTQRSPGGKLQLIEQNVDAGDGIN